MILQSNPGAGYLAHKAEIDAAVMRALESKWYILGKEVAAFEEEFAAYLGASHAVGVASGTDAIQVALRACDIGPGDAVFTVSHTAVATVAAIDLCGATPVFVDIDPQTYVMDAAKLEAAVKSTQGGRAKAVLPVHLYGHPADMAAIGEIARRYGLRIVEDCAQSHGALWQGKQTGTLGDIAAFSFYPTKNLGALGDGGAVVTSDAALYEKAKLIREYGWKERYVSAVPGMNSRLDELQAAILRARLPHLESGNQRRRQISARYHELLADAPLQRPVVREGVLHAAHQFVVRLEKRDEAKIYLAGQGVGTLIHYPVPVHLQPAYAHFAGEASLPHTEAAAREVLSLPLYPELEEGQVEAIAGHVREWFRL